MKSVYSMMIVVQIIRFLYGREAGKPKWGESMRGRTRELEKRIKSVGDRV